MPKPETKTDHIVALVAAGVPKAEIMVKCKCSQAMVYKVIKNHSQEIARLKGAALPATTSSEQVQSPAVQLPTLDPARPAAPQLESMAWAVIAQAAFGGNVSAKQAAAAREIIKQAARDKTPPATDRQFKFKVDVIDIVEDKMTVVESKVYEIKKL